MRRRRHPNHVTSTLRVHIAPGDAPKAVGIFKHECGACGQYPTEPDKTVMVTHNTTLADCRRCKSVEFSPEGDFQEDLF